MVSDDDNELAAVNYLNTQEGNEAMSFCVDVTMRLLRETGDQNGKEACDFMLKKLKPIRQHLWDSEIEQGSNGVGLGSFVHQFYKEYKDE
jgi:hypothetical protein|tara:strand:+ start:158 stop:427 length:270 start_codon:yes stop_codon:yes gene_type:complete